MYKDGNVLCLLFRKDMTFGFWYYYKNIGSKSKLLQMEMCENEREEIRGGQTQVLSKFILFSKYFLGDQLEEDNIYGTCSTQGSYLRNWPT